MLDPNDVMKFALFQRGGDPSSSDCLDLAIAIRLFFKNRLDNWSYDEVDQVWTEINDSPSPGL